MSSFFVSDLDFTLLRSDMSLSDFTKDIWNRASQKTKLSIATARSYTGVKELLKGLELKEPLILLDGVIIAKPDGKILHLASINKELGSAILEVAKKNLDIEPLIVALSSSGEEFLYPKNPNIYQQELLKTMKNRKRVFANDKLEAKENNLKIVFQANKEKAYALEKILKENFKDNIEIKLSKDPYINCYFITILNPLGDKAHALAKLEEIEGVDIKDTTAFGDSHNDLGMFEVAGVKVAVKNAIDELKQKADIVLPWSNDEDGVARYLKERLNL
ncbi:MAG: Cof-type HAD-IIB family hydrolase [Epsilonproteobacteria bacterium]|nr:Cof-type HAD-IIB family hydrolase [Campylobacterota bacterium]